MKSTLQNLYQSLHCDRGQTFAKPERNSRVWKKLFICFYYTTIYICIHPSLNYLIWWSNRVKKPQMFGNGAVNNCVVIIQKLHSFCIKM